MKRNIIDEWRAGNRRVHKIASVKRELERLGFAVAQGKKHWKAAHPELVGSPEFPYGLITFSAHAFGNQGEVHPSAISDFLKAIAWIENK